MRKAINHLLPPIASKLEVLKRSQQVVKLSFTMSFFMFCTLKGDFLTENHENRRKKIEIANLFRLERSTTKFLFPTKSL